MFGWLFGSKPEKQADMTVEEEFPELMSAARMEEIRPGRNIRLLVVEPQGFQQSPPITLFFVHGSCARMAQFYDLIRKLKATNPSGYRFVAFDAYGCGGSPQPHGWTEYSTAEHRKDLSALFQKFGDNQGRNVLIGHSYGTSQVLHLDSQTSAKVKGLVLIGAICKKPPAASHPIFSLPNFILDLLQPTLSQSFNKMAYHSSCDKKMLQASLKMSNGNRMYMCKAFYKQMEWVDEATIKACKHPVLVLHGRDDQVTPLEGPAGARELAELVNNAQLEIIDEASHQVMMEKPEATASLVHTFAQKASI